MISGGTKKLTCIAHDEDHSNHALYTALWSSVQGCPFSLYVLAKPVIEDDYHTAIEALADFFFKSCQFTVLTVIMEATRILPSIHALHIVPYKPDVYIITRVTLIYPPTQTRKMCSPQICNTLNTIVTAKD